MKNLWFFALAVIVVSCSTTQKVKTTLKYRGNILEFKISENKNDSLGALSGELIDSTTREAIPYVYAQLEVLNSRIHKTIETDYFGKFNFTNLKPGNYTITLNYVGYYPFIIKNIAVERGKRTFYKIEFIQNGLLLQGS
jgi:hypothetical protein